LCLLPKIYCPCPRRLKTESQLLIPRRVTYACQNLKCSTCWACPIRIQFRKLLSRYGPKETRIS
ncbi:hypothetical protein KI387_033093, partial [Taxus chinensis]